MLLKMSMIFVMIAFDPSFLNSCKPGQKDAL